MAAPAPFSPVATQRKAAPRPVGQQPAAQTAPPLAGTPPPAQAPNVGGQAPGTQPPANQGLLRQIATNSAMRGSLTTAQATPAQTSLSASTPQAATTGATPMVAQKPAPTPGGMPAATGKTPDQMWQDVMSQYDASGKNIGNVANAYESNASRRASEMSQGAATGGGFAAGMAQASIGGEQNRQKLGMEHDKQGMEMKMTYLGQLLKQAEANKDRQQAKDIQNMIDRTQMQMSAIDNGQVPGGFDMGTPGAQTSGPAGTPVSSDDRQSSFNSYTSMSDSQKTQTASRALNTGPDDMKNLANLDWGNQPTRDAAQRVAYEYYLKNGSWPGMAQIKQTLKNFGYITN